MDQSYPILNRLFSLEGKTALVTGAAGGIGGVLAVSLAQAGATVAVHARSLAAAQQAADDVAAQVPDAQVVPVAGDLASVEECRRMVAETVAASGRLDILINNAATNRRGPIAEVSEDDFDAISAVNTKAVYFLSQSAYPHMKAQGGGKIIHIGSANAFFALDTVSVYGLTKGAVAQMTKAMAIEWAPDNIQVNCVSPGFMMTPLSKPIWEDENRAKWFRTRIPQRRPGLPEELVGAILLLACPASSYITGQTLIVDGGFEAGGSWLRDPAYA
ncbi:MAG: glucose 1-dehydrogenase [Caldilineaceae bacterium]|nr:glucose 1-dehydrogenase [Caldilineaceae bacterium]MBP8110479.1 glucose 1-dehydrogenase [Caldilineaceae bacterium]MBP8125574.1 glucose 1-dehydrogenase [Caldilineaceae bacterium]